MAVAISLHHTAAGNMPIPNSPGGGKEGHPLCGPRPLTLLLLLPCYFSVQLDAGLLQCFYEVLLLSLAQGQCSGSTCAHAWNSNAYAIMVYASKTGIVDLLHLGAISHSATRFKG